MFSLEDTKRSGKAGGKKRAQMTRAERGRKGGLRTKANWGVTYCPTCHQPLPVSKYFAEIGRQGGLKGGKANFLKYGTGGMSERGRLGGRGNKSPERLARERE